MPTPSARRAPSTASMLHCLNGHSLTDVIVNSGLEGWPGNLPNLFISQFGEPAWNYPDTFAKDTIPGSPLRVRWNDNSIGRTGIAKFDALVTTETVPPAKVTAKSNEAPMKDTLDYLVRFAENTIARGKGRKDVIMWAGWPHKDGSPAFGNFRQSAVEYGRSFRFFSEYATWKARRKNPNLPADWRIWTFNTNAWWIRFFDDIQARAVPGITDHRVLFRDDIHLTPVGEYALSVFFYTCLYQKDARTLSYKPGAATLSAALDEYFKRIAFEVASAEASIGMGGTANAEPTFNPATHGDPLDPSYVHGNAPAPTPPVIVPEPEPQPEPQPEPEPVDPTPTPDPEPEQPDMSDRAKLTELLSYLRSSVASMLTQIEELQAYLDGQMVTPDPEVDPVDPVDPTPVPVPASPIWDLYKQSILTIPTSITVPAGAADIYIPVSVDNCDRSSFMAYVDRLANVSGGGINVGNGTQQRANFAGMGVVYHWSPGDDPIHWIKISPRGRYGDGSAFNVNVRVKGLGDNQKGRQVTIRFAAGAPEQEITQPFHRPLRRLDLSRATRKNTFNPATLRHSPNGAGGTWMSALSHGRSQDGNQETGLYADATISGAESPITYDAAENAIRLHSTGYATPVEWDNRMWRYQAAVLQGLHMDEVCGVEGVWRMEAKIPVRRYSWPAFWLVNRSKNSQGVAYNQWPGEIDILEKFNHAWGAADTPYTSSFAQHFGPLGRWEQKVGSFGNDFDVDQYGSPRTPLDEVYTSWAVHVAYDPIDTTKSEVTFFVNDREVGCQILHARHQDLNRKVEFYPIFNVAVKTPRSNTGVDLYSPERYNTDDGRGKTGDMLVRDVAYYPTGARFV